MQVELEAKFLNINPEQIRQKLRDLGATCEHGERLMRRHNFDFADRRLEKIGGWVRLRDEGDKITLSYKQLQDRSFQGTREVQVVVDNYERTSELLQAIGLKVFALQETRREKWLYDTVEIVIDTWPWIPTFIEIEGETEEAIKKTAELLGCNWAEALHGSVETAYQTYYQVTDQDIYNWPEMKFSPVPDWLEAKKK